MDLTPKAIQVLRNELDEHRAKQAWDNLQEIRWGAEKQKDTAGVLELAPQTEDD